MDTNSFIEDLFWTSYRYCIGRHSYVGMLAKDMANYFYDKLNDDRLEFTALDIRRCIADQLHFQSFNFDIDYTVVESERRPLEMFIDFLNTYSFETDDISKELAKIRKIDVYKKEGKICYEVSKTDNPKYDNTIYEWDIMDLKNWSDLASLFDKKNHKIVVCEYEGKTQEIEVFESFKNQSTVVETLDGVTTLRPISWKYEKIYKPVDGRLGHSYIEPSVIKEIKNIQYENKSKETEPECCHTV